MFLRSVRRAVSFNLLPSTFISLPVVASYRTLQVSTISNVVPEKLKAANTVSIYPWENKEESTDGSKKKNEKTVTVVVLKDFDHKLFEGDVVEVAPGYMRHFLYPNRICDYATKDNLQKLKHKWNDALAKELQVKKVGYRIRKAVSKNPLLEMDEPVAMTPEVDRIMNMKEYNLETTRFDLQTPITNELLARRINEQYGHILSMYGVTVGESDVVADDSSFLGKTGYSKIAFRVTPYDYIPIQIFVKPSQYLKRQAALLKREELEKQMNANTDADADLEAFMQRMRRTNTDEELEEELRMTQSLLGDSKTNILEPPKSSDKKSKSSQEGTTESEKSKTAAPVVQKKDKKAIKEERKKQADEKKKIIKGQK